MAYIDITRSYRETMNRRVGTGLVILGTLLCVGFSYSYWKKKEFSDGAAITVARIVQNDGVPTIEFLTESGEIVTAKLDGWRPGNLKTGDEVEIAYSAKEPQRVELKSDLWTGQWVIAILALVSSVIGWLMRKGLMVAGPLKQSHVKIGL